MYTEEYFGPATAHPTRSMASHLYNYMQAMYLHLFGSRLSPVLKQLKGIGFLSNIPHFWAVIRIRN